MPQSLTIPHQYVTYSSGEDGAIRASLTAMPDGSAQGHLSMTTRAGAHRYRAISGTIYPGDNGEGIIVHFQLEELHTRPGLQGLAEMVLECTEIGRESPATAAITFHEIPSGDLIVQTRAEFSTR